VTTGNEVGCNVQ